jgi:acetyl-CoA C-acetyltransferase
VAGGTDPRTPCIIGVGQRTWHPDDVGAEGAPEPLVMWDEVAHIAADDTRAGPRVLNALDSVQIVFCQTSQYDDAVTRLAARIGAEPRTRFYSGIGGTTPQVVVSQQCEAILRGDVDLALVTGAEALATQRKYKQRGERASYSFRPAEKRAYPWEAPFHPAEVAHDVFQAWLTFAIFDNARRGHLGIGLDSYREQLGRLLAPMTEVAAKNPYAWFRTTRAVDELITATPQNRTVGYPYTKYMVSIMDVDMAAAVILASEAKADELGVPAEQRVYPRGWCYATDPVYLAEHDDMWCSPAMAAASTEALRVAGIGVDDVATLDLYSCFASSVNFARDALGLREGDTRPLTVTGGLPYHGGAGSNYMTHSIAQMATRLRDAPGSFGMVSGVGMHMTKHTYAVYSTTPGPVAPPEQATVQAKLDAAGHVAIVDEHAGPATVAAYSIVHGREGTPEWGVAVCDVAGGARCYAKLLDPALLSRAEEDELVGAQLTLETRTVPLMTGGEGPQNVAVG